MTRRTGHRACLQLLVICLLIFIGACRNSGDSHSGKAATEFTDSTTQESQSEKVAVAFGDSITQGVPFISQPPNGRRIGGYEPELERLFNEIGTPVAVLNYGVSAETTSRGVGRIDSILDQSQPEYILILEGTNDLFAGISIPTTIFNLSVMIDKSRGRNVEPIIATLSPDLRGNIKNVEINYNPEIMNLAEQKGVLLADQYNALIGENWDSDGIHPNDLGYRLMAREWFVTVQQAMNSNR